MRGITNRRRVALAALTMLTVLAGGLAQADPINDALSAIFKITDVAATGVDPGTLVVTWKDSSVYESGSYVQYSVGDEAGPYTTVQTVAPCSKFPPTLAPDTKAGQLVAPSGCTTSISAAMLKDSGGNPLGLADPRTVWIRIVPFVELPNVNNPTPGQGTKILEGAPSLADPAMFGPLRPTDVLCNGGGATACHNVTSVTITWTDNSDEEAFWIFRVRGTRNPKFGSEPYRTRPANVTSFHEDILGDAGAEFSYKVTAVRIRPIDLLPDPRRSGGELTTTEVSYADGGVASTSTGSDGTTIIPVIISPVPAPSDPCCLTGSFSAPSTVTLHWVDVDPNPSDDIGYIDEDGWLIELAYGPNPSDFDNDTPPTAATMLSGPQLAGQGTMTWKDSRLLPQRGVRCYRVRGYRFSPDPQFPAVSKYTNVVCFGALPIAPSGLVATAVSNASVNLSWRDNATTEDHYIVQRCLGVCSNGSTWNEIINNLPMNTTSYVDPNTTGLTTYSYRVIAANGTGPSAPSNIAVVTTLKTPLPAPTALTAAGRQHAIFLTWQDNSTNETGFRIEYRAPGAALWSLLTEVDPHAGTGLTTYLDRDSLSANQRRCYRVRALKNAAFSDASNEACDTTLPPMAPDAKPTAVKAVPDANNSVVLTWNDASTNEAFFRIEMGYALNTECNANHYNVSSVQFHFLADVTPRYANGNTIDPELTGGRSFKVTGLVPHSVYFFRIKAVNPDGESDWGSAAPDGAYTGTIAGVDQFSDTISGCAQTFGPRAPIWTDPDRSGTTGATRCDMTINADRLPKTYGNYTVGGIKVEILAQVAESGVAYSDVIFANSSGFSVPNQAADSHHAIVQDGDPGFTIAGDSWKLSYQFRHGIQYKLFVTSYLQASPFWGSARPVLTDITVAADCPLPGILGNRP